MENNNPIDDSLPILTDEALEAHVLASARSEITLKDRGTFQGIISREKGEWQMNVTVFTGTSAVPKAVPFHLGEVTELKMLLASRRR